MRRLHIVSACAGVTPKQLRRSNSEAAGFPPGEFLPFDGSATAPSHRSALCSGILLGEDQGEFLSTRCASGISGAQPIAEFSSKGRIRKKDGRLNPPPKGQKRSGPGEGRIHAQKKCHGIQLRWAEVPSECRVRNDESLSKVPTFSRCQFPFLTAVVRRATRGAVADASRPGTVGRAPGKKRPICQ